MLLKIGSADNKVGLMSVYRDLACLAGRFGLRPVAGQPVEPNPSVTLRPRQGVPMHVTPLAPA